ncbi:precorrin-3B C(17)-methyltransferase [Catellatospora citrea]|uniref:Precorrin-3B C(17)-methyltransferase n=1 Tax=Catellatospora citrea TaxID=53366 RepID=A0A8J3P0H7_9ACTN|nr:precorrin-3B C(17)-methyltransferase [Catellatospora citrea]RKE07739.1 cobalt-precorrin 5A hydrolase/precorrin-3B C17-methyltransferase [Catellatospora citrea]GIF99327.1 precorrin-3B C(17)-methyltransferase [Catellatospora citrea]
MTIGLIWATAAGRAAAQRLAAAWPGECTLHEGRVRDQLTRAWSDSETIVAFLATGATVRLLAPLLAAPDAGQGGPGPQSQGNCSSEHGDSRTFRESAADLASGGAAPVEATGRAGGAPGVGGGRHTQPGVVCVDEAGRWAVALLGGHGGGANALAARVSDVLGATPVVTTGTDATGLPGLDMLGFAVANPEAVAPVSRALLDGEPVHLRADQVWPLPALPANLGDHPGAAREVLITDRLPVRDSAGRPWDGGPSDDRAPQDTASTAGDLAAARSVLVLRPPSLVLGIGASRGVAESEIAELVARVLDEAGLAAESVCAVATADVKADEAGLVAYAASRGLPLLTFPAAELAAVAVPNPSEVVRAAVGTPSVAEAAALLAARARGREAALVAGKTASAMATVAVARLVPAGRLVVIGLGPGAADLRTPRATAQLRASSIVVGLDQYVDQVRHLLRPGTRIVDSGLGAEEERARSAVELARQGHAVALIGSGDAGVYAMASPALEFAGDDIEVTAVPGVTAALAASSLLGAPLGHDHVYLSLSDLHTPWEVIERRLEAAARADLVVCLYNPRSARRTRQLPAALAILGAHRPPGTPIGLVRDASRAGERIALTTLEAVDPAEVDMNTVVIVGASTTRTVAGRMVTPRGYAWMAR